MKDVEKEHETKYKKQGEQMTTSMKIYVGLNVGGMDKEKGKSFFSVLTGQTKLGLAHHHQGKKVKKGHPVPDYYPSRAEFKVSDFFKNTDFFKNP